MIRTEHKEIGGVRFGVTTLPGMRGLRMQNRLLRIVGPALARASDGDISTAVGLLFDKLSDDELESITKDLLYNATANDVPLFGAGGSFDGVMAGKAEVAFQLIMFAIQVNFGGFFDVLAAAGQRLPRGPMAAAGPLSASVSMPNSGLPTG